MTDNGIDQEFIKQLMSEQHLIQLTKQNLEYYDLIGELEKENKLLRDQMTKFLASGKIERGIMRKERYVQDLHQQVQKLQQMLASYRRNPPVPSNHPLH